MNEGQRDLKYFPAIEIDIITVFWLLMKCANFALRLRPKQSENHTNVS